MDDNVRPLLRTLVDAGVEFTVIGGIAAILNGASYFTEDVDIAYERSHANIEKLVGALRPFHPKLRVAREQDALPFIFDAKSIANGSNFTFSTDLGDVDVLGSVSGFANYVDLRKRSRILDLDGVHVRVLTAGGLIIAKEAAGREKDHYILPQLRVLAENEPTASGQAPPDE